MPGPVCARPHVCSFCPILCWRWHFLSVHDPPKQKKQCSWNQKHSSCLISRVAWRPRNKRHTIFLSVTTAVGTLGSMPTPHRPVQVRVAVQETKQIERRPYVLRCLSATCLANPALHTVYLLCKMQRNTRAHGGHSHGLRHALPSCVLLRASLGQHRLSLTVPGAAWAPPGVGASDPSSEFWLLGAGLRGRAAPSPLPCCSFLSFFFLLLLGCLWLAGTGLVMKEKGSSSCSSSGPSLSFLLLLVLGILVFLAFLLFHWSRFRTTPSWDACSCVRTPTLRRSCHTLLLPQAFLAKALPWLPASCLLLFGLPFHARKRGCSDRVSGTFSAHHSKSSQANPQRGNKMGSEQEQAAGEATVALMASSSRSPRLRQDTCAGSSTLQRMAFWNVLSSTLVSVVLSTCQGFHVAQRCWRRIVQPAANPTWSIGVQDFNAGLQAGGRLRQADAGATKQVAVVCRHNVSANSSRWGNAKSSIFLSFTKALPSASALALRSWCASWYFDLIRQVRSVGSGCCHCQSSGSSGCCFPFLVTLLAFAFAESRRFWPRPRTAFALAHGTADKMGRKTAHGNSKHKLAADTVDCHSCRWVQTSGSNKCPCKRNPTTCSFCMWRMFCVADTACRAPTFVATQVAAPFLVRPGQCIVTHSYRHMELAEDSTTN